jgi:type IV pilus assembly protein PilA
MFSSVIERFNEKRRTTSEVGEDAAFTLIELMVVLLILAILLAIAIPTFLGVTKSANDRAAQSNLNTAFTNAKSLFQQNSQSYPATATLVSSLAAAEPSLTYTSGPSTGPNNVSVVTSADGYSVSLAVQATSTGNCWYIVDNTAPGGELTGAPWDGTSAVFVGQGTYYGEAFAQGATCAATAAPGGANTTTGSTPHTFQTTGGFPALS